MEAVMKAIVYSRFGSPDVLRYEDVEKPAPGATEVLVRIRAASVNPLDWHFMRGTPYIGRAMFGLLKPRIPRLGADLAGEVEAVGGQVTRFKPGDAVFGAARGACAEYACAAEASLAAKPESVTFEQAAAVPVAGITALQGLRDKGRIQPGHRVLVHGAAGGVGTFAVQIARAFGASVTGVCSTRNVEMVRSIGAHEVVDYTRDDFTRTGQRYDVIFDCIGDHPVPACARALAPQGTYVMVGGPNGRWLGPVARLVVVAASARATGRRLVPFLADERSADLEVLADLMATGKVTPVIDRRYTLREVPEAIRYLEEGHARGKVVITVA
jgi:NADPH:quinone reductase-like Zn-dependent oxidoreductase